MSSSELIDGRLSSSLLIAGFAVIEAVNIAAAIEMVSQSPCALSQVGRRALAPAWALNLLRPFRLAGTTNEEA